MSRELYRTLESALRQIADERSVRAAILTGSGRAFCVGADLKAHGSSELSDDDRRDYVAAAQRVNRLIQTTPKPFLAAVNGHAIGAGLELALSCDLIIVASDAKLRLPEVSLGTFVGGGVVYTLAQRIGVARAKEVIMLGDFIQPNDAQEMGLVNKIVDADAVFATATEMATALASQAPISLAFAKQLLNQAGHADPERLLELEADALLTCMKTRDWREGVLAFAEKRKPTFSGE